MSQRQRDHVPLAIRAVQMNRSGLLLRFDFQRQRFMVLDSRFDFSRQVEGVFLGEQPLDGDGRLVRIAQ